MASSTSRSTPVWAAGSACRWRRACRRTIRSARSARSASRTGRAWTRPRPSAAPSTSSRSTSRRRMMQPGAGDPPAPGIPPMSPAFRSPLSRGGMVTRMSRGVGIAAAIFLLTGIALAAELKELRVCADPDNLPFSNQKQQGLENKIAEVMARDLGVPLTYYWWPHQRGLVRNTLRAEKCDVLIGVPKEFDAVLTTAPYYRSTYVLIYPKSRAGRITS